MGLETVAISDMALVLVPLAREHQGLQGVQAPGLGAQGWSCSSFACVQLRACGCLCAFKMNWQSQIMGSLHRVSISLRTVCVTVRAILRR